MDVLWERPGSPVRSALGVCNSSQPEAATARGLSVFWPCFLALWNLGVGVRQSVGVALLFD